MAFSKRISTRGTEGTYIRLGAFRWDPAAREASALFSLFTNKQHAERAKPNVPATEREKPLVDIVAKVRIMGDAFDRYLGPEALAIGAAEAGTDILAHFYLAAKEASQLWKTTGMTDPEIHVVSDFGGDLFADAKTV